jgi:hypothetical protein
MLTVRSCNLRRNAATRSWWEHNTPVNAILDTNVVIAQPTTKPIGPTLDMARIIARQANGCVVPPFGLPHREGRV